MPRLSGQACLGPGTGPAGRAFGGGGGLGVEGERAAPCPAQVSSPGAEFGNRAVGDSRPD